MTQPASSRLKQNFYRALSAIFLALAAAGVVLPVLPTTPFVIVAAWAAGKSSPELRERLRRHPVYGPSLRAWQDHGAVSRRAVIVAIALMSLSWVILWFSAPIIWIPIAVGVLLCSLAIYLITRPAPPDADRRDMPARSQETNSTH